MAAPWRSAWLHWERLRERSWLLRGRAPSASEGPQPHYWYRLTQRVRDPRTLWRWYANDSML